MLNKEQYQDLIIPVVAADVDVSGSEPLLGHFWVLLSILKYKIVKNSH